MGKTNSRGPKFEPYGTLNVGFTYYFLSRKYMCGIILLGVQKNLLLGEGSDVPFGQKLSENVRR